MLHHPRRRQILGLDGELWVIAGVTAGLMGFLAFCTGCALYDAVVGTVESGGEAAEAARDAAAQTKSTLAALETVLVYGGIYLAGELRRPLVKLGKKGVRRCKNAMANHKRDSGTSGD